MSTSLSVVGHGLTRCYPGRADDQRHLSSLVPMSNFHDFEMTSVTGEQVSFDQFQDQVCLVVNVASN
mgnify:CR=1 FL=1